MGFILEKIEEAIKELLIGWIESNMTNMFTDVNDKVGTIAAEVGKTPSSWDSSIYQMIRGLSENVIVPIAGIIITFVLCYELISMITEKNNLHDSRALRSSSGSSRRLWRSTSLPIPLTL